MGDLGIFTLIIMLGIIVQSFAGFAGSLLAIPLYSIFFVPKNIIPAHSLVMLLVKIILVLESKKHLDWKKIKKLQIAGLIGVPIGAYCLAYFPSSIIRIIISIISLIFGLLFLVKIKVHFKENTVTQSSVGLLSGFLGGSISESGPPVVIYGLSREWPKDTFRTCLLTYFLVLSVMANLSYFCLGMFNKGTLKFSLFAIIPALIAGWIGTKVKNLVSEELYKKVIIFIIIAVAIIGLMKVIF